VGVGTLSSKIFEKKGKKRKKIENLKRFSIFLISSEFWGKIMQL